MASLLGCYQSRRFRRAATALVALAFLAASVVFLSGRAGSGSALSTGRTKSAAAATKAKYPLCSESSDKSSWPSGDWREAAKKKFDGLLEEKFTIALSTFHRPKELARTLDILTSTKIPSLLEVAVIWNNFDEETPASYVSKHGVSVRYRKPTRDSLNEKLWPDPAYRTQAILLTDDDVFYRPEDLEFVFQMWRQFGKDRMTGALARCTSLKPNGEWEYNFCSPRSRDNDYSIVLTNLAFTHISFLDYYFSNNTAVRTMREYVDKAFNCEDIALNFVSASLTRSGPLLVRGRDQFVNMNPAGGISRQAGHMEARSQCVNLFAEAFKCMPLVDVSGRIERGVKHNVWYMSVWDMIRG